MKYKSELNQMVKIANNKLAYCNHDFTITLEYAYGKPRLYTHNGARELSPRLSNANLYIWLSGYIEAMDTLINSY
jgi:hypothetical protein